MLGLTDEQYRELTDILGFVLPGVEIRAFGSRVHGSYKPYSDLDLIADAGTPIDDLQLGKARGFLSASNLPFRVDLLDAQTVSDDFKKIVGETLVVQELGGE